MPSIPAPCFAEVQAMQRPLQAVSQQTPSTQLPLTHSVAAAQVRPSSFLARQVGVLQ